jgi:2-methylcitrate dehydratase PrpD
MTTLERKLAKSCVTFQSAQLSAEVRSAALRAIRDWLGCAIVGAEMAPARAIASAFADEIGRGRATCFVGANVCEPQVAALVSGVASHSAEVDDIYSPALYHPGVCVISAALAACQSVGARGDRMLRAVIAGYEISNRIGTAVNPAHYEYWHTTGTVGTIGAAVGASVALGLDETQ